MKPILSVFSLSLVCALAGFASELSERAWNLEKKGDLAAARELLDRAAHAPGAAASDLADWAGYLDRHRDPQARPALEQALAAAAGEQKAAISRELVVADLLAGDNDAARRHLTAYHDAGGKGLEWPSTPAAPRRQTSLVTIPGPLPSFSRMAALAPDLDAPSVLSALARNVVTNGYQASSNSDALDQTEYLKLVIRYVSQARELSKLAGKDAVIRVPTCDSTETGDLLRVLGYRIRGSCGSDVVLETVNPSRAFLTIDSGFPLAGLEQALRTNRPFTYEYKSVEVPVVYGPDYWLGSHGIQGGDLLDAFLNDPSLCRLYLAMTKLDPATADEIRKSVASTRLRIFAHVIDFFGGMFEIRDGRAVAPGGPRTDRVWAELAGASPEKGADFFDKLISKDDGWLASYYDSLARISGPVHDYLTEPERLKRFYLAIRGKVTSPGPARPVFRSNTDMVLLTNRLRIDANGKPVIPGGLDAWRDLFVHHTIGKTDAKLSKAAAGWKESDDVLEALFGLCRKITDNEPLRIFMSLSDVDRGRRIPLDTATAAKMIKDWRDYGAQYPIFAEVTDVSAPTLVHFLDAAEGISGMKEGLLRADTAGTMQALVGLWQILYRNGSITPANADKTLAAIVAGFTKISSQEELFAAGRSGVNTLLAATGATAMPQERLVELLGGPDGPSDPDTRGDMVRNIAMIFEAQRLISISDLFAIADGLAAHGEKGNSALVAKAAARIADVQLPHASLSSVEKNVFTFGYWSERHVEAERKMNLKAEIDRAGSDARKLAEIRGDLAPLLRDSLVGLNYAYYAPPGAEILQTNPLFVRSHDFIGLNGPGQSWKTTEVEGGGWPTNSGGKLAGSLAELPYALAQAEQNFLVPSREQALIWSDLVPQLLMSSTVPRWWHVSPAHTHWVQLHMDYGETLLAEAALNAGRRQNVLSILHRYAAPVRVAEIGALLEAGDARDAVTRTTPSELFELARASAQEHATDPLATEIGQIAAEAPDQVNYAAISRLFGTPKPTLANSMMPQLLSLRTFPALMGYSSRILAESWESDLLYYASMADQLDMQPARLNLMVPYWTRETIEGIFATHLEDWPALLRSLRSVGSEALTKSHGERAAGGAE